MNLYGDQIFNLFVEIRGIEISTADRYHRQLELYCKFRKKTPTELIDEAEEQSDQNIRKWKRNPMLLDTSDHLSYQNNL